ncbi:UDP-N-acetylmuramoyl-tripeptide--D-alanyl-D-alanine ligase [Aquimarina addita]|uniref:UDP-N-acetylmuramoyl-tripeptide--D-alanyl-D-alanine ligase n=1 Tax=Aquimarina addita TaxID=870485 RepID=A0ABP7XGX7_9FLAO
MKINQIYQLFLKSSGVCTDTRSLKKDNLFFALKGTNFNGNEYASQALKKGAAYAIVDEKKYDESERHIFVNDALSALQELASYHRKQLGIPIVALTGSNGKTTTKELINCVLSTKFNTVATKGNLNNHIGVPLTLLSMSEHTQMGIIEMGANHIKEIAFLSDITNPDYGYITNIGKAHLEGFGGIEGVLKGKTELYEHLRKNNNLIFLNAEDQKLSKAAAAIKKYTFSQKDESDVTIKLLKSNPMVSVLYKNKIIESNLIGSYNFTNVAAAIAIGNYFKIEEKNIKTAIESYIPENNRSQIINKNQYTIILDAYNANPSSISVALDNFEQQQYDSKTVFLGDMFELGHESEKEHQKIVDQALSLSFDTIYLIGHNFYATKSDDARIKKFNSYEGLANHWSPQTEKQAIFIKGSRGMKLERILELL